jgi:hypothetical protein
MNESNNDNVNVKKYCIRPDYVHGKMRQTMDGQSQSTYWNPERIKGSERYQYYVYHYAASIVKRNELRSLVDVGCDTGRKLKYIHNQCPRLMITGIDQEHRFNIAGSTIRLGLGLLMTLNRPVRTAVKMSKQTWPFARMLSSIFLIRTGCWFI